MDPTKKKSNVFTDHATRDECQRLGIYNWWKTHAPERAAFIEYVVKPIAGVRPSASNTERSNSLHKLLIGDKRAIIKIERAYKLLYIYQNGRALDEAKAYGGSSYALPELSCLRATIEAEGDDEPFDDDMIDVVSGFHVNVDLTDDEEALEMIDVMEGDVRLVIGDDGSFDDDDVDDADEASKDDDEDNGISGISEDSKSANVEGGREDELSSSCKKRARALNDGADEVDWRSVYGVSVPQPTRRGGGRGNNPRGGRARGNARGQRGYEPSAPELTVFELERQRQILRNTAILQQHMVQPTSSHFPTTTLDGVGWQPQMLHHLPPLGHASMTMQIHMPPLGPASTLRPLNLETSAFGPPSDVDA